MNKALLTILSLSFLPLGAMDRTLEDADYLLALQMSLDDDISVQHALAQSRVNEPNGEGEKRAKFSTFPRDEQDNPIEDLDPDLLAALKMSRENEEEDRRLAAIEDAFKGEVVDHDNHAPIIKVRPKDSLGSIRVQIKYAALSKTIENLIVEVPKDEIETIEIELPNVSMRAWSFIQEQLVPVYHIKNGTSKLKDAKDLLISKIRKLENDLFAEIVYALIYLDIEILSKFVTQNYDIRNFDVGSIMKWPKPVLDMFFLKYLTIAIGECPAMLFIDNVSQHEGIVEISNEIPKIDLDKAQKIFHIAANSRDTVATLNPWIQIMETLHPKRTYTLICNDDAFSDWAMM